MHIPDGFLAPEVFLPLDGLAVAAVGLAATRASRRVDEERHVPLLGVCGAFVFAAQGLNFPLPGATSGHVLGAALAGILLGPAGAVLVLAAVLIVQAVLFGDGGLLALGANITNMALLGGVVGSFAYRAIGAVGRKAGVSPAAYAGTVRRSAAFVAAWLSVVLSSAACALELVVSNATVFPPAVALPAMIGPHLLIGVAEGVVTVAALELIAKARPDLLELEKL